MARRNKGLRDRRAWTSSPSRGRDWMYRRVQPTGVPCPTPERGTYRSLHEGFLELGSSGDGKQVYRCRCGMYHIGYQSIGR